MSTLSNVKTSEGEEIPSCTNTPFDAIPRAESSRTGVSVDYVRNPNKNWYVFRGSYGRENLAHDFLIEDGTYCYIPKRYELKNIGGKRKRVLVNLIPNLLFVYTTPEMAEEYIKNRSALSFLSYYYDHFEENGEHKNPPLKIPLEQMENFIFATSSHNEHIQLVEPSKCRYKSGERVRVIDGLFKGVEGRVARVSGQQRVIVVLSKIGLISTAYIPTAFIERIEEK